MSRSMQNKAKDKVVSIFQPLANRVIKPHWETYVLCSNYEELLAPNGIGKRLTAFSVLRPEFLERLQSVEVTGVISQRARFINYFRNREDHFERMESSDLKYKNIPTAKQAQSFMQSKAKSGPRP